MAKNRPILKGERIILRGLKHSDAESIYKHAKHKEIIKFTDLPYPYRLRHAKEFVKNVLINKNAESFGIELIEKKEIIGIITISKAYSQHNQVGIGYWIGRRYHGKGIMSEVMFLILDFIFMKMKMHRVYCCIFEHNIASQKLVEKFGFKHEGISREGAFKFGKYLDAYDYGLLKKEWLERRKELMK